MGCGAAVDSCVTIWSAAAPFDQYMYYGYAFGYLFLLTSTFALDHFELFGITQSSGFSVYEAIGIGLGGKMARRLHYNLVRHPIMTGFFIMFWCVPIMTLNHMVLSAGCTVHIIGAVYLFEEPDLVKLIGSEYVKYQEEVPAYCPFIPTFNKKSGSMH